LSANTGVEISPDAVCTNLSCEINFNRTVDRSHFWILPDHGSIVHIGTLKHCDNGIVMYEIIQLATSHCKRAHDFSLVFALEFAIDNSFFNQRKNAIGKHFGVNTEILMIRERCKNSIWNFADACLKSCAVFNERRDISANL